MKCPFCHNNELKVTDSRDALDLNAIRRRRECLQCQKRFTTFETIELTLQVHKRDGRFEDFQMQKLINGLDSACRHTSVSREKALTLANDIANEVSLLQTKEITTSQIGDIVMQRLRSLDPIAYIRFACVYHRFKDVKELVKAIEAISPKDLLQNRN